jgi:acyl-CoA ligase (AMP-forming) (exosortase A-associated)
VDFLINHMLRTSARRFPKNEALVHGSQRLTYREVLNLTAGLTQGLRSAGLRRGDRVGIFLDSSVEQVISIFGIAQAGGVFVPVNGLLLSAQVSHIANDCQIRGLITSAAKLAVLTGILTEIPSLEFIVVVGGDGTPVKVDLANYSFDQLCSLNTREPEDVGIEKDLAAILYTSGSTGKAKGVMLSHANIIAGSSIVSTYLNLSQDDRILAVLPFSFDAGLNQLMTAFQQGCTIVLMTFVFAMEIVEMLLKEHITGLAGVPTVWNFLAHPSSKLQRQALPHLRYITNTGGAMPQRVLATLRQALPTTKIFLMYGLTEAFRSTYLPPEELDRRPTSIGKAIPNTEILVINDAGQPCRPGEIGELVHRGPTVSLGYWGLSELTDSVLKPHPFLSPGRHDGEKVCFSGDLARADEEGFLYFVGRRDNMIKSSGFRVSPTEVEEILFQSGKVREAAVIGVPDEILGQTIKAFVAPQHDGESLDIAGLLDFCAEKLPRYMVPAAIEVLSPLPKTPTGKVDYPTLRRREGLA